MKIFLFELHMILFVRDHVEQYDIYFVLWNSLIDFVCLLITHLQLQQMQVAFEFLVVLHHTYGWFVRFHIDDVGWSRNRMMQYDMWLKISFMSLSTYGKHVGQCIRLHESYCEFLRRFITKQSRYMRKKKNRKSIGKN